MEQKNLLIKEFPNVGRGLRGLNKI